jgi:hypothetical protein
MKIYASGGLQDTMQLNYALSHHGEVRHHIILTKERPHGL